MNRQIRRVFLALAALFAALVGMTSYWLWKAPDLEARRGNPTLIVRQSAGAAERDEAMG